MPHPFLLFTWNKPLLPQLKDYLDARHPDADVVPTLITPNFRPWKYLQTVYASEKKPRILARVLPFGDALALWHTTVNKTMPADASILDMVWLLHEAASQAPKALDPETGAPVDILSGMDIDAFYPWGQHLAGLVEEMLSGGILPEDIDPCDDEALPQVARILESLGSIGSIYLKLLRDSHLTTAGLKIYEIMASLKESSRLPAFLTPSERRPVYIIAGHGLSRAEEVVYKALWEAGAHICLHTDPALAGPAPNTAHWSTRHHKKWLDSWQPGKEYAGAADNGTADTSADIRFFAGYDLHSQLKALKGNLADDIREAAPEKDSPKEVTGKDRPAKSVAIVLPSSSLLMPVLHHMPAGDRQTSVSIAMGLPVASTAVHQLLLACLTLQTERDEAGRYHWRKLVGCIDTPVLGFLNGPDGHPLQPALLRYRSQLLAGRRFVDPDNDVLPYPIFEHREEDVAGMRELLPILCTNFENLTTLNGLADALQKVCDHFRLRGNALRTMAPVDMEALYHVEHGMIPKLRHCLMADEPLALATITRIFDQVCRSESIAFEPPSTERGKEESEPGTEHGKPEAEPDMNQDRLNIQILSLRETALLSFDEVHLLDATDDVLPGPRKHDPLLPESLRALVGLQSADGAEQNALYATPRLPSPDEQEQDTAFAVFRLCASSGSTTFYWQEGSSRSQLFDGKKSRTRFAEEFIWKREKNEHGILTNGRIRPIKKKEDALKENSSPKKEAVDTPAGPPLLHQAECSVTPMHPVRSGLILQRQALDLIPVLLKERISPSFLDDYLRCPMAFGFKHLAKLTKLQTVNEGDDPLGVGTFMHKVLEDFHSRHMRDSLPNRAAAKNELIEIFDGNLNSDFCLIKETLPPESLAFLRETGHMKLRHYIDSMPADIFPVLLEDWLEGELKAGGSTFMLRGRIDRLDCRPAICREEQDDKDSTPGKRLVIMDYKTSKELPALKSKLWQNKEFLDRIRKLRTRDSLTTDDWPLLDSLFHELREMGDSVQLAAYVTMHEDAEKKCLEEGTVADAVFVQLAEKGEEVSFFPSSKKAPQEEVERLKAEALPSCPDLVALVALHMLHTKGLEQFKGNKTCGRCDWRSICGA